MAVTNNNNPASWTALNGGNLVLQSNVGTKGVRDPSLIRSPDGSKFWIIATDLNVFATGVYETENGSKGIVVWSSNDLKTWSAPTLRTISPSNAGMTWAPDAIWDSTMNQYMVFWTCALKGDGWYIMKSYTSDFVTFSTAQKYLSGAGMDATIALDKSTNTFYRISKNGPGNLIEEASATSLAGSWRVIKDQIGSGTLPAGEGPLIFQNNQNPSKWHLFIDDYTRGRGYAPFETTNIAQGNWVASTGYSLPQHFRHGYVIPITSAQRSCLTGGTCSASSGSSGSSGGSTSGGSTGSTGSSSGTVAQWGQCGGIGYTGPTTCVAPYKCTVSNAYYSQCI
ncbi:endo-1,4-beta-xylanase [Dendrothele bispora CBS 962.96]|uniref:Endo-1,4-beta-xylanase n=1 Tax=Dendrothele bispora (strain CBS 962.96) TaxID=1314807 RepID=A0A4S8LV10_DENBC|nr:endo-1,4-beta-xylanase [Dendrothele bispora CBS 962.96]